MTKLDMQNNLAQFALTKFTFGDANPVCGCFLFKIFEYICIILLFIFLHYSTMQKFYFL